MPQKVSQLEWQTDTDSERRREERETEKERKLTADEPEAAGCSGDGASA